MILLVLGRLSDESRDVVPLPKEAIRSKFDFEVFFENGHIPVSGFSPKTVELLRKKQMRLQSNNRYMSTP